MKNKLIILLIILLLCVFSAFFSDNLDNSKMERFHQHLSSQQPDEKIDLSSINADIYQSIDITKDNFKTHLPIIEINTNDQLIPAADSVATNEYITVDFKVYDEQEKNNTFNNKPNITTFAQIRYRGNSSLKFDKKGIRIKLVDDSGNDDNQKLLGMSSDNDYVLHGPYLDKTLLRNYLGYNITAEIMGYSPNVRFCEVFINNEYQGLYLLVETVKVNKNRVNVTKIHDNSFATSYMLEINTKDDLKNAELYLNNFSTYTKINPKNYFIQYPTSEKINNQIVDYIENDLSYFEKRLYSYDYDSNTFGYYNDIDINSFINYTVINEFFLNYDAGSNSTIIYKDITGKYKLVFWDMNSIFDNYFVSLLNDNAFYLKDKPWFEMLFKDEYFTDLVIARYKELRETYLDEEYLNNYIDEVVEYLGPAIYRNFVKWGNSFTDEKNLLIPVERNIHSYSEAIEQLKYAMKVRGQFLDDNIESIRQFSHESKVKNYNP